MPLIKNIEDIYNPTKRQLKAHKSKATYLLVGGAMAGGKTVFLCIEALHYALHFDSCMVLLCRKYLVDCRKHLVPVIEDHIPKGCLKNFNRKDLIFEFKNGSKIVCFGLSDREAVKRIMGLSVAFIGLDQGDHIEDDGKVFRDLTTRLRQVIPGKMRFVITSNPTRGWVRKLFIDEKKKGFEFIQFLPKHNKYLPKNFIKEQERTLTKHEFEINMLGKWEKAQPEGAMFSYDSVMEAFKKKPHIGNEISYGLDIGLHKSESVLIKRHGNKLSFVLIEITEDLRELANRINKKIPDKNAKIYCDAIGYGSGVIALLQDRNFKNVEGVNQSERSSQESQFYNKRAENFHYFSEQLEGLILEEDLKLKEELLSLKKTYDNYNRLKIELKMELHKRGQSPSRLDACVLSILPGTEKGNEADESELTISSRQWHKLCRSLEKLEEMMFDIEKHEEIDYIKKNEKILIEEGLVGTKWREYRKEYDRLIRIFNRCTEKGWKERNIWRLKSREMSYTSMTPIPHLRERLTAKEDNQTVDVNLSEKLDVKKEEEEKIGSLVERMGGISRVGAEENKSISKRKTKETEETPIEKEMRKYLKGQKLNKE